MISNIFIVIVVFLALHYFYFLLKIFKGLGRLKSHPADASSAQYKISVIIPFRNESKNILDCLNSLENQDYPKGLYEVILVNDNSDDNSFEKLIAAEKSDNIRVVSVPVNGSEKAFKKNAVTFGIENSTGEVIVTTDADCLHNRKWLTTIVSYFDEETGLVSGPVEFENPLRFFDKIQKLEFHGLILVGAGLIGAGEPVICSAANLAYKRKAFDEVDGFTDQFHLTSGDDELLMQKIWKTGKFKIKFCPAPEAIVVTGCNPSLNDFLNQRKRWASKGLFYADKFLIFRLILIFFYYLSIPVLSVLSFIESEYFYLLLFAFGGKLLIEYLVMKRGNNLIFNSNMLKYFFPAEILQIPYIIVSGILGAFGNFKWKNRTFKR